MGHASLRANTTGYAEKVRTQFLSLRQSSSELRTPPAVVFTPKAAARVLNRSSFGFLMRTLPSATGWRRERTAVL